MRLKPDHFEAHLRLKPEATHRSDDARGFHKYDGLTVVLLHILIQKVGDERIKLEPVF